MKLNWNFLGRGMQKKKPSAGKYGHFLELHIVSKILTVMLEVIS